MTSRFHATFENGVLIPQEKIDLPEHRTLTLILDESENDPAEAPLIQPSPSDPNDPMPAGGVELVDWQARHRLQIDPKMADKIALSKAYGYYEEPEDE